MKRQSIKDEDDEENEDEDEVEDYMSNGFLTNDLRPGLVKSRVALRKHECEKVAQMKNEANRERMVQSSSKALEQTQREEVLSKSSIEPSNVGFKLMQKMGYQKGQALGKESSASATTTTTKLLEPIRIEIKLNREGLGNLEERKRKINEIDQLRKRIQKQRETNEVEATQSFLDYKRIKFQLRRLVHNLHKCQRVCFELDSSSPSSSSSSSSINPEVKWYWPISVRRQRLLSTISTRKVEKTKCTEETATASGGRAKIVEIDESESANEQQPHLTRQQKQLQQQSAVVAEEENKPLKDINIKKVYDQRLEKFIKSDDHQQPQMTDNNEEQEEENEEDVDDEEVRRDKYLNEQVRIERAKNSDNDEIHGDDEDYDNDDDDEDELFEEEREEIAEQNLVYNKELIAKKVDAICLYLRDKYFYCVWCAIRFESELELAKSCPGLSESDHDDS